jgi:hypothetical protein
MATSKRRANKIDYSQEEEDDDTTGEDFARVRDASNASDVVSATETQTKEREQVQVVGNERKEGIEEAQIYLPGLSCCSPSPSWPSGP